MFKNITWRRAILIIALAHLFFIPLGLYFLLTREKPVADESIICEPVYRYGIRVDSLMQYQGVVKTGENLSTILQRFGVNTSVTSQLVNIAKGVFDVRRIRAGNKYTVICRDDSLTHAEYFIYEDSPTTYVVFALGDSLHVYSGEKEVERRIEVANGTIEYSLWSTMIDQGLSPALALELSDIYAWTIDFFGIQKGDSFVALYEQLIVDGDPLSIGRILAACFNHAGRDYYAFYYVQDGKGDYFDADGNSLRKAFLKTPLKFSRISSHFSHSRKHPVLKIYRPHHGVDYAAPVGTPVMSIGNGTVTKARVSGGAGKMVEIRHNSIYTTQYLHLSGYGKGIREGARVSQGQVIGYVGSTGLSTGPHLDFRVYKNGTPLNPLKLESPPGEPVQEKYRDDYFKFIAERKKALRRE